MIALTRDITLAEDRLGELTKIASESSRLLVDQQATSAKEMNASTQAMLATNRNSLGTLFMDIQTDLRNVMDGFKLTSAIALEATSSNIETNLERMEHLNRVMDEFDIKQGDISWQLRTLHQIFRFFSGKTLSRFVFAIDMI